MTAPDEPDRIEQLRERRAEHLRAAEAGFETPPRLRDQSRFFNSLLNGDLATYERVGPLWRDHQQNLREAGRITAEIEAIARQRVTDEPGYRALVTKGDQERTVRRSAKRVLASIRAARSRINRVRTSPSAEASRSTADRDAKAVSKRLREVRQHADELKGKLARDHSFDPGKFAGLDTGVYGGGADHKGRSKQYKEIKATLGSLEKAVRSLLRDAIAREKVAETKQRQYMKDGRARYGR